MIKIRYILPVLIIIFSSWLVSVSLTRIRIQTEAENKLLNLQKEISPFVWNFEDDSDVVSSYYKYWQHQQEKGFLSAKKGSNPRISLNFSSEIINSGIHGNIIIKSPQNIDAKLLLQAKQQLDDDYFYYSYNIPLSDKDNNIDLTQLSWIGLSDVSEEKKPFKWGNLSQKISSIVLIFENPNADIILDEILLPYSSTPMTEATTAINCDGDNIETKNILLSDINIFELQEYCLFPSKYMWLKSHLIEKFPESILTIKGISSWQSPKLHKINHQYSSIESINAVLYAYVLLVLIIVYWVFSRKPKVIDSWVSTISEPNLLKSWLFILSPTILLFIPMLWMNQFNLAFLNAFPQYFVWAMVQQFFLGFILSEKIFFTKTCHRFYSALAASLIFATLHLPSFAMFGLTFVAGLFWAYSWLKFKRLLPLALSHSLLALVLYAIIDESVLYSAKVFQWFWK